MRTPRRVDPDRSRHHADRQFRAARERDAKLFETAAEVLSQQFKLTTYRQVAFLNVPGAGTHNFSVDEVNADAFAEAYKDLVNLADKLTSSNAGR